MKIGMVEKQNRDFLQEAEAVEIRILKEGANLKIKKLNTDRDE